MRTMPAILRFANACRVTARIFEVGFHPAPVSRNRTIHASAARKPESILLQQRWPLRWRMPAYDGALSSAVAAEMPARGLSSSAGNNDETREPLPLVEHCTHFLHVHFPSPQGSSVRPATFDFHAEWLRHHCPSGRHPSTGELTTDPIDYSPDDCFIVGADITAQRDGVVVKWSQDGTRSGTRPLPRTSAYSLEWLRENAYGSAGGSLPRKPPSALEDITFDVSRAKQPFTGDALVNAVYDTVSRTGVVRVTGVLEALRSGRLVLPGCVARSDSALRAEDSTEPLVDAFVQHGGFRLVETHFGRIEDLRTDNSTNKNTDQLGYTQAAVLPHTDQPFLPHPPRYQLLQGIRAADTGGSNMIVDAFATAVYLHQVDPAAFRMLSTLPVRFDRRQRAFRSVVTAPILTLSEHALKDPARAQPGTDFQVRFSYFTHAPFTAPGFVDMPAWYRAYRVFSAAVRHPEFQYRFTLAPADFVLYDNFRMLHARSSFTGPRWVRGIYFDRVDSGSPRQTSH